ncbi:MAG: formylglycine-generating enzyme family protein [Pseudomonadota bacterium]
MRPPLVLAAVLAQLAAAGCERPGRAARLAEPARACPDHRPGGEVALKGGTFLMGADPEHSDEGPPRQVTVGPFSIDRTEVTNAQFAEFVKATGYVTLAERDPDPRYYPHVPPSRLRPSSLVFVGAEGLGDGDPALWWQVTEGAQWRRPEGPGSDLKGRERHPVVQVAYQDALAYARWKGRDLPTEAEWEFAARAGLDGARYEWGDGKPAAGASPRANTWQGLFPAVDTGDDGYKARTAPVACYAASAYGLYDMTGNVWEWTKDLYAGSPEGAHLVKGGSFLCADNFCYRYRPSARQPGPPDTGTSHVGFRTVKRG